KDENFDLTDRIILKIEKCEELVPVISNYYTYICTEILADKLEFSTQINELNHEIELNEINIKISVQKN
ncbi:MAG: hypothetical protein KA275_09245, partial [Chitinophagaceae bacterium]|nr:hypothetical protein [Chitinophagaceae bacterium]